MVDRHPNRAEIHLVDGASFFLPLSTCHGSIRHESRMVRQRSNGANCVRTYCRLGLASMVTRKPRIRVPLSFVTVQLNTGPW